MLPAKNLKLNVFNSFSVKKFCFQEWFMTVRLKTDTSQLSCHCAFDWIKDLYNKGGLTLPRFQFPNIWTCFYSWLTKMTAKKKQDHRDNTLFTFANNDGIFVPFLTINVLSQPKGFQPVTEYFALYMCRPVWTLFPYVINSDDI